MGPARTLAQTSEALFSIPERDHQKHTTLFPKGAVLPKGLLGVSFSYYVDGNTNGDLLVLISSLINIDIS